MAIVSVVLEKPLGEQAEGTMIQVEEEVATALVSAGVAREATEEDVTGGDDAGDDAHDEESLPEMASVARNVEEVVTKATEKAVQKLASAVQRPHLNGQFNAHVAGSDYARTGGYKSLGDAILGMVATRQGDVDAGRKYRKFLDAHYKAPGMSIGGGGGAQGGSLVPQEWASELWRLSFKDVPDLMGMCQRYEMRNQVENIPAWVQASGTTGVTAGVVAEAGAITATIGTTSNVQLSLVKGAVLVNVSDELLRFNSYNLTNVLQNVVPERIRYLVNDGVVNGTNGQINLVNNAAAVAVARQTAGTINFNDVIKMRAALWESFRNGAAWFISPGSTPALYQMAFPSKGAATPIPVFLPGGFGDSLSAKPLGTLLGLPIYEVENVPALGAKGDLILAHLPSCAAGFSGLIADSTPYLYFDLAQESFRFLMYYDTVNPMTAPYTRKDGTQASNIVVLDVP